MAEAFLHPPVLKVKNLTVAYRLGSAWQAAVREVSFTLSAGETLGLVGESGSGKTTLALAVLGWLGNQCSVRDGQVELFGRDLLALDARSMQRVWGKQIGFVPQNPQSSLNPALRIGEQLEEPLRQHLGLSGRKARRQVVELLERVQIAGPRRVAASYPHQISGGMQQRVMIAMALAASPALLVLDEPTTNLDVTTQAAILDLIQELIQDRQTAVLYVTHDMGVVAQICDRMAVMYAGELVEQAATTSLFAAPQHPYTIRLLESIPSLGVNKRQTTLRSLEGQAPPLGERPAGCVFRPRCPLAVEVCLERPPLYPAGPDRFSRCHRWEEAATAEAEPEGPGARLHHPHMQQTPEERVLELEDLQVHFRIRRLLSSWLGRTLPETVKAVNGVSLSVERGRSLGLVGESGSGKTTLARAVMGLLGKTDGEMKLLEQPLPPLVSQRNLAVLQSLQLVFQDPEEAFNPYGTIEESLRRPLRSLAGMSPQAAGREVSRLLEAVRLPAGYASRTPGQISGGEKQRLAIARAIAAYPALIVCDEPVSSLDVSVQAAVLNLLADLQDELGASLLVISHNLAVVGYLADTVAVIYLGFIMEITGSQALFQPPFHPYTEALLAAVPVADPTLARPEARLSEDIPNPARLPSGCPFHPRCPRFLGPVCVEQTPPWQSSASGGKRYWCHIPPEDLLKVQQAPAGLAEDSGAKR